MNPDALSSAILDATVRVLDTRGSATVVDLDSSTVALERPKNREHGDWSTSIALKLGKLVGSNPRELASELQAVLAALDGIRAVDIAGPGFLNITLDPAASGEIARTVVAEGDRFGHNDSLVGHSINLEYVSANPTGPLHIGHTRWAALGDCIGRVLRASGASVADEFYINDAGAQMDVFGESVLAAALGEPAPENAYPGEYIGALATQVLKRRPDIARLDRGDAIAVARDIAYEIQLGEIKESLARFNVEFDVWFSERDLHAGGADSLIERAITRLRAQGHVFDEDDAVWVRTTDFGDDKDRVIRRGNGVYTYFAADAAYYLSKTDRGFRHKIYLLGADHHGYVHRLKALAGAAGDDPDKDVEVLIGQLVSINGARLSKRAGNIIELDDLREWLGTDALRYSLARYPADSPLSLDPELLQKRTNDNPVFYVQYAHARTSAVSRNASTAGVDREVFRAELLDHPTEADLATALADFPRTVALAARFREPHRVARYLEELAGFYHRWYDSCRVTPLADESVEDVHRTRLWLNDATGQVLRNGLTMLGVSAPERM